MNPIRIAILTIATVSATTVTYTVFAPSPSTLVSAPVQTQVEVASAPVASQVASVSQTTSVVASAAPPQVQVQYVDVAAPSQNAYQAPRENEDGNGENNDSE